MGRGSGLPSSISTTLGYLTMPKGSSWLCTGTLAAAGAGLRVWGGGGEEDKWRAGVSRKLSRVVCFVCSARLIG